MMVDTVDKPQFVKNSDDFENKNNIEMNEESSGTKFSPKFSGSATGGALSSGNR